MRSLKCLLPITAALCGWFVAVDPLPAQTWAPTSLPTNQWAAVASSADGTKLAVAGSVAGIYTSTNAGTTWMSNNATGGGEWESIASSADGTKLVAAGSGGIYTNSGTTWAKCSVGSFGTYPDSAWPLRQMAAG